MSNEFWAAIVGAVTGAVVGGIISFCIQLRVLQAAATQRAKEAEECKKALAHSLSFKMIRIYSHLHDFHAYLEEQHAKAQSDPNKSEPWQFVLPLANLPEGIRFSPDEMAMLLSLENMDLFNDIISMDDIHNSTVDLFKTFRELRSNLTSQLPTELEGTEGTIFLTREQLSFLQPKMVEINELATLMKKRCELDAREAGSLLTRLVQHLNDKLKLNLKIQQKPGKMPLI